MIEFPGYEEGFEISECPTRCLNDTSCRGFSIITTTSELPVPDGPVTIIYDSCILFTTSNATSFCTFNFFPENPVNPSLSTGPLDPNANCTGETQDGFGNTYNYYDGCHIRMDLNNFTTPMTPVTNIEPTEPTLVESVSNICSVVSNSQLSLFFVKKWF